MYCGVLAIILDLNAFLFPFALNAQAKGYKNRITLLDDSVILLYGSYFVGVGKHDRF